MTKTTRSLDDEEIEEWLDRIRYHKEDIRWDATSAIKDAVGSDDLPEEVHLRAEEMVDDILRDLAWELEERRVDRKYKQANCSNEE